MLSGGGARGAYEVGVLSYIMGELPQGLVSGGRLGLLCGTSVGAIHACFLASSAQLPGHNVARLEEVWRGLKLEGLMRLGAFDLLRMPSDILAMLTQPGRDAGLLFHIGNLHRTVTQDINWPQIQRNMATGHVHGLTVSSTHVASGRTVVFVDSPGGVPSWTRDKRRLAKHCRIGPLHALASAAIPLLFPTVSIDGAHYCDGGLRQNTPLSPALRLGADRVLVISVGHGNSTGGPSTEGAASPVASGVSGPAEAGDLAERLGLGLALEAEPAPTAALVFGKVLNALLLDHLDYDLAQLRGFNRLLEDGEAAFGPSFSPTLAKTTQQMRGASYRKVDPLVIRPSRDLGEVALAWMQTKGRNLPGTLGAAVRYLMRQEDGRHADLLSYLTFDGSFAAELIALGRADADAAKNQLIAFFTD